MLPLEVLPLLAVTTVITIPVTAVTIGYFYIYLLLSVTTGYYGLIWVTI